MKKKIASILLMTTVASSVLSACGTNSSTNSQSSAGSEAGNKVEVEFWYAGGKTAVTVVQEIIDEYNASQDTYYVKAITQADYGETYEKLQAGIAGNAAPDMVLISPSAGRTLNESGLLDDLNAYLTEDVTVKEEDYLEVFAEQGVSESGARFGLPAYGTTQVLYYNISAFEKANIDPNSIATWQDLAAAAKAIKATGEFTYGWEPMWGPYNLIDASLSNGAKMFSEDGKTVTINSEEWVSVWESFRTWIHDDEIMAVNSGGQGWEYWYNTIDDVLDNTAGGYTGSSGDQADLDFNIVQAMEQPAWDEDSTSAPAADALLFSVVETSSKQEKAGAFEFVQFFTNIENQIKWTKEVGYVAVNKGIATNEEYLSYVKEHPQALVPFTQASHGSVLPIDPTGGAIYDALTVAADQVELENIPAQKALDTAQKIAQQALVKALNE
ncbi:extracellular solute-binding protein [Streptococcus suis]